MRSWLRNRRLGNTNKDIFEAIYAQKIWGGETEGKPYSGIGTYDPSVPGYINLVRRLIDEHNVQSIVEIGCGDFTIGAQYANLVHHYLGVDVAESVIIHNRREYERDGISFLCADAGETPLPPADLCLIRQVLQHLSNADISRILDQTSAHKLVLITEHLPPEDAVSTYNRDKRSGPDTRLPLLSGVYIDKPPFNRTGKVVFEHLVTEQQASLPGEVLRSTLLMND